MLTTLALALLIDPAAAATEVGTARKFGLGAATGNGYLSAAGKYWFKPNLGVSFYLGNGGLLQQVRGNFEMDLFTVRDTEFGKFDLYWLAGLDAGMWLYPGFVSGKLGFGAGLGVDLKFHDWPLDAFVDVGLGGYPFDICPLADTLFCYMQPRADLGVRYYFE